MVQLKEYKKTQDNGLASPRMAFWQTICNFRFYLDLNQAWAFSPTKAISWEVKVMGMLSAYFQSLVDL